MSSGWYYAESSSRIGPLDIDELGKVLRNRKRAAETFVWRYGFEGWQQAGEVRELKQFVALPPPLSETRQPPPKIGPISPLAPEYQQSPPPSIASGSRFGVLKAIWLGEYGLGQTFWGAYVAGCAGAWILAAIILAVSIGLGVSTIGFILAFLVSTAYWLVASVGVWKSATTSIRSPIWMTKLWGYAARGIVLLVFLRFVLTLVDGGALKLLARMTAPINF